MRLLFSTALAGGLALGLAGHAFAQTYQAGSIEVVQPWARATPPGAEVGGGYMTIINHGGEPDTLIGGSSPAAGKVEVHQMKMEDGVMHMRPLPNGLEIKPGETVTLDPNGYHLMLMQLKAPLKQGGTIDATLQFKSAGTLDVKLAVESFGAMTPSGASDMDMSTGGDMNMDAGGMNMGTDNGTGQ